MVDFMYLNRDEERALDRYFNRIKNRTDLTNVQKRALIYEVAKSFRPIDAIDLVEYFRARNI